MKEITLGDVYELKEQFDAYCDRAEQHEFLMLAIVQSNLEATVKKLEAAGKVENQKDIRAMFRFILKYIGKDYSEYMEDGND